MCASSNFPFPCPNLSLSVLIIVIPVGVKWHFIMFLFFPPLGSQQNWAESSVPRKLPSMSTPPQLSHYQYHMSEWWTCNLLQLMKPALSHLYHPGSIVYIRFPSRCCRQWKITRIHCCSCPVELFHHSEVLWALLTHSSPLPQPLH